MDLILLGIGEDGHTASLFPGNPTLGDNRLVVPVLKASKPPPERVSMGSCTQSIEKKAHHDRWER